MRAATKVVRLLLAATIATVGLFVLAPPAASAATQSVMIENYSYSPSPLTVHVGDTVTWTNHDQAPHDVTTTSAPVAIKSPMMSTGQSFTYAFTTAGTYSYYCSIHPDMRAQVIVQPAAAVAPVPAPASNPAPRTTVRKPAPSTAHASVAPQPQAPAPTDGQPAAVQPEQPQQQPAEQQPQQQVVSAPVAPTTSTTLDPMLIVAGVAAGIVVLCLLLLGSRRESS